MISPKSLGVAEMTSINRDTVSVRQDLRLVGPRHVMVPLTASWHYSRQDPYAVKLSLDVPGGEPVVWAFDRELLATALHARSGIGDVRAWPSAASKGASPGKKILNIVLGPPSECAHFKTGAAGIEAFLAQAYGLVPAGQESACLNLDAGLAELLSQA
jgi:Streptomyces sporulation and cell division protein, SsgA